jgi:hypothetical protein
MIAFKDYIVEYYKGDPIVNPRMTNGKDPNRVLSRINQNTANKTYKHKAGNEEMPVIDNIINGKVQSLKLSGQPLMALLAKYDITFSPGETKVLGNSAVEVEMSEDVLGNTGVFRKRKTI